jgi:NADPH:quinone reductase-like Zn-dependent oxidoreductase
MGAIPIAVVSSDEKAELVRSLGASLVLDRRGFALSYQAGEPPEQTTRRIAETRRFGRALRQLTGGKDPEVVFEHVGCETFPASVFLAARFGRIVICGATSGYELAFDVRHLWMRQKQILGSHFANAYQAHSANELVLQKKIRTVIDQVLSFHEIPLAHQLMMENKHKGKLVIRIQSPDSTGLPIP